MRVYAVADIHGKPDRLDSIRRNLSDLKADILVIAGDITNYAKPEKILEILNTLSVPILAIRGNTDFRRVEILFERFENITPIHAVRTLIDSVPFVGIGGTIPIPFRSRVCLNEASLLRKIDPLVKSDTILVTHAPPLGYQDRVMGKFHAGSPGISKLLRNRQPRIIICGHIHENPGVTALGPTHIVNCAMGHKYRGALITFGKENRISIDMI